MGAAGALPPLNKKFSMQISLFSVAPGDSRALDDLNRCLRGHRVLTLDRHCDAGVWSFCVTWQPGTVAESGPAEKVDYKEALDEKTFALFSHLRVIRKALAEKENLPPYAVFTNEQLAEVARRRCAMPADLGKIDGIGTARVEKYGAAIVAAIATHEKQQGQPGTDRPAG
jgi:superfamily II DNA helicase RecQ